MNNFNLLAPIYDTLAHLVFGQTLHHASIRLLDQIPAGSGVLVLGGGTGKLLHKLKNCEVVYVEKSLKMLQIAKKRNGVGPVDYVHADFLRWRTDQQFDVVICPFFLDVFSDDNLSRVLKKINELTTPRGKMIVTDFQRTRRLHHQVLLQFMHWFFLFFSGLESRKLSSIEDEIISSGYNLKLKTTFKQDFIFSAIYQRG